MTAAIVLVVIALAAAALLFIRFGGTWLRWFRLRGGAIRPRHPVVLVHGYMGWEELRIGSQKHAYFRGIRDSLEAAGVVVYSVRLPPLASVAARAKAFADFVQGLPARRVNVIAHSMGGLDVRYAISKLGLGRRLASLVTVGTPHRGTPLADVGAAVLGRIGLGPYASGLSDLTTVATTRFNDEIADASGVFYGCVITSVTGPAHPLLSMTHGWLRLRAGDNDGIVPRDSQCWGEIIATVPADHWAAIGWSPTFDACALYATLARELRARGL